MNRVIKRGEKIPAEQRTTISRRYKRVTSAINKYFWNIESDIQHSIYVGSYGRGTAVDTSDIDILIELPESQFDRFDNYKFNGQSSLLQVVKDAILTTYPNSNVRADGQVVQIDFSDGIMFELLPAFKKSSIFGIPVGGYRYPDANMGGRWKSTDPKAEQFAMKKKNEESGGLLYDTCKHMRAIRDSYFTNCDLPGIVIDSFVYHAIGTWRWLNDGEVSSQPVGTYEKTLAARCNQSFLNLTAPGSGDPVDVAGSLSTLRRVLNFMAIG